MRLRDRRRLGFQLYGTDDPAAPVVFALHGTPGSRLKFVSTDEPAKALGLRIVAPDRWGYGLTDIPDAPCFSRYADDLAQLAAALSITRFGVMGVSGGGPYAVTLAAKLPAQVNALALVSPVGQIAGAPSAQHMSRFHKFCFLQLPHMPTVVSSIFRLFRFGLKINPDLAMKLAMARAASADKQTIATGKVSNRLSTTFVEGLRPGTKGPVIDLQLFGQPWDVDLTAIKAAARLWIGSADQNVPVNVARELARQVPDCVVSELAGEGHLWVATHYEEVLTWLGDAVGT